MAIIHKQNNRSSLNVVQIHTPEIDKKKNNNNNMKHLEYYVHKWRKPEINEKNVLEYSCILLNFHIVQIVGVFIFLSGYLNHLVVPEDVNKNC